MRRVREAARLGTWLAVVDAVLPDSPSQHPGWLMDLNMLALTGGRERTAQAFADLLEPAGWRVERVTATDSPLSVVLASAV